MRILTLSLVTLFVGSLSMFAGAPMDAPPAVCPEPGTIGLLGLGIASGAGMLWSRRRKK